ncbi:ribose 5-phosphate isomerase B [Fusobacterium perfoetens]|jgi:ribose 5-phosphate isomerase B|uniref:ribose 5-phosphate isomerase B n=1 Tax=Fusobacterium perfoetens TaxID=852 RepID=UPI001F196E33|nr:ribose 5-phosphate isomerase B [Fusobacterium perfoetens]MCF2611520.1 ribose 5-phosphate isomerase B [Fusobacterium perfoetens]
MKIALGCDHGGYELKEKVKSHLEKKGYEVLDLGCHSTESVNYPVYGKAVGEAVAKKEADYGVVICGTGIGISIAANKVKGVRAALCMNTTMARLTREHNDANVLAFGARMVGDVLALEMVDTFLTTAFEGGRHVARVEMLED